MENRFSVMISGWQNGVRGGRCGEGVYVLCYVRVRRQNAVQLTCPRFDVISRNGDLDGMMARTRKIFFDPDCEKNRIADVRKGCKERVVTSYDVVAAPNGEERVVVYYRFLRVEILY